MTIRVLLWGILSIFAFASVILLASNKYFDVMIFPDFSRTESISLVPYFLCYIFNLFVMKPLGYIQMNWNITGIKYDYNKKQFITISMLCVFIMVIYLALKIYQFFTVSAVIGVGNFHEMQRSGQDELFYSSSPILLFINYLGRIIVVWLSPYLLCSLYIGYVKKVVKKVIFLSYSFIYCLNIIIVGIVAGSRGMMFFSCLTIVFFLIIFKINIKRYIPIMFIVLVLMLYIVNSITTERFSEKMSVTDNIARYFGESFLNLGFEFWNHLKVHTGLKLLFGQLDAGDAYSYTGVQLWWFQTIYGELFIAFNAYLPLLIAVILSFIMVRFIKNNTTNVEYFGLILFYYQFCCYIPFGYSLNWFTIVTILGLYFSPKILKPLLYKKNNLK